MKRFGGQDFFIDKSKDDLDSFPALMASKVFMETLMKMCHIASVKNFCRKKKQIALKFNSRLLAFKITLKKEQTI